MVKHSGVYGMIKRVLEMQRNLHADASNRTMRTTRRPQSTVDTGLCIGRWDIDIAGVVPRAEWVIALPGCLLWCRGVCGGGSGFFDVPGADLGGDAAAAADRRGCGRRRAALASPSTHPIQRYRSSDGFAGCDRHAGDKICL